MGQMCSRFRFFGRSLIKMRFVKLGYKLAQRLTLRFGQLLQPPLHGFVNPSSDALFIGGPLAWHAYTIPTVLVTVNQKFIQP